MTAEPKVALAHDYLSVRGGAERVVGAMARVFADARIYTSFFVPEWYPELAGRDITTSLLNRSQRLARHYRVALPLLPTMWDQLHLDAADPADVVVCSTTGWAHGLRTEIPKIAYCHNPARWLYQLDDFASTAPWHRAVLAPLAPSLRRWDQRAAMSCVRYVANSSTVARRIEQVYRRESTVVWPPSSFDPVGPVRPLSGIEPGFVLCVSRLLGYKNVRAVVEAARIAPEIRWLVIGDGPLRGELERDLPGNVVLAGAVDDSQLRWAYQQCVGLVSAAFEDFGLTPVEAAMCGKPSALLRAGGFIDTCVEGTNGLFFDDPTPPAIAAGARELVAVSWNSDAIVATAERFSEERFGKELRAVIAEVV